MNNQKIATLTLISIIFAAALQPVRANAHATGARTDRRPAQPMQAVIEGETKASQESEATPLISKPLPDFPGKEVVMITVTYPRGRSGAVHRHNAHGFIYVLEGSVVMGVNGGEPVTLSPGQTFYEGPNDSYSRTQREQHQAGQISGIPHQEQRCSDLGTGELVRDELSRRKLSEQDDDSHYSE